MTERDARYHKETIRKIKQTLGMIRRLQKRGDDKGHLCDAAGLVAKALELVEASDTYSSTDLPNQLELDFGRA